MKNKIALNIPGNKDMTIICKWINETNFRSQDHIHCSRPQPYRDNFVSAGRLSFEALLLLCPCDRTVLLFILYYFFHRNIKINLSYWSKTSEDSGHHLIPCMVFVCVDSSLKNICSIIILTACNGADWDQD
jgi:hypothetical protein